MNRLAMFLESVLYLNHPFGILVSVIRFLLEMYEKGYFSSLFADFG